MITIDAPLYDELFGQVADSNAEGSIIPAVPITADTVQQYASSEPSTQTEVITSAARAALDRAETALDQPAGKPAPRRFARAASRT